jgi:hypothetical protein
MMMILHLVRHGRQHYDFVRGRPLMALKNTHRQCLLMRIPAILHA